MSKLTVAVTTDFSATLLDNVKLIDFTNPAGSLATAIFVAQQFGPGQGPIQADVAIDGSAGTNRIVVTGNSVSAAHWTFSHWSPDDLVTFIGTQSFDEAEGTSKGDRILGLAGDDLAAGMDGNDMILGGAGDDRLMGGDGNDVVRGGSGKDDIQGDAGRNVLSGGGGDDRITSNTATGGDRIDGGAGFDVLGVIAVSDADIAIDLRDGGGGRDIGNGTVAANMEQLNFDGSSGSGNDRISCGGSDDSAVAGRGNDRVWGFGGDDLLIGGEGHNQLHGGTGGDTFISSDADSVDRIFGGAGTDTAGLGHAGSVGLTVDISDGGAGRDIGTGATLRNIEILFFSGGKGDDLVTGGDGDDSLGGGGGQDVLTGGAGADDFVFDRMATRFPGAAITDFTQGSDLLDVSLIDALPGLAGNRFTFIGDGGFTMTAGELGYFLDGNETIVQADLDGDGAADFVFTLATIVDLKPEDFGL